MRELTRDFAGAERTFRLRLGDILDVEEACGGIGIFGLFKRFSTHEASLRQAMAVVRLALVGGGMAAGEARRLVEERAEIAALEDLNTLAIEVVIATVTGIPPDDSGAKVEPDQPLDAGAIFSALVRMGVDPERVRQIAYADFVRMVRAMNTGDAVAPPTEEEYLAMLAEWEARQNG